jgi:DNA-binding transcriptional regulator/RsmH inhibitor MraZ
VDIDKQGRFVLPDRLVKKAGLQTEVYLIGQKQRIEVWNRDDFDRSLGIDWEGDEWPDWQGFLRQRPTQAP